MALALLAGAGCQLSSDPPEVDRPDQRVASLGPGDRAAATTELLGKLERALDGDDAAALAALAAPESGRSRPELAGLAANVRSLDIDDLSLTYLGPSDLRLSPDQQARYGTGAWVADVELTWRLGGLGLAPATAELPLVLGWTKLEARFVTARAVLAAPAHQRVPLWVVDRVAVRRTGDTLVLAADKPRAARLSRQAAAATDALRGTLPGWRGVVVVEVPATRAQFEVVSGLPEDAAAAIAAVTTTVDGSNSERAPVHVYVNPGVFDRLGPQGQQIVVGHEAAHVALEAATTSMPMWVSEGVADYLALVDTELPVTTLAAQALDRVRELGPPARLPGADEFDATKGVVGAAYESSWLAARLIAERHGERALLDFYNAVDRGQATSRAFREVLGTTRQQFERRWRDHLCALAG